MSDDVILQPDDGYIGFDEILARAARRADEQPKPEPDEVEGDGQECGR